MTEWQRQEEDSPQRQRGHGEDKLRTLFADVLVGSLEPVGVEGYGYRCSDPVLIVVEPAEGLTE